MKAIFLDIDGVLNSYSADPRYRSKSNCGCYTGIDKDKTKRLATIVEQTDAILVLTSSWKVNWNYFENRITKYLINHLKKKGNLTLAGLTKERDANMRGSGIRNYLIQHPEILSWIVLDDEIFPDYEKENIIPHLLKINGNYGLTDADAEAAIKMLNKRSMK